MKRRLKKQTKIIIAIIILLILVLTIFRIILLCKNKNTNLTKETKITLIDNLDIEVFSEINNLDLIKDIKNGEITSEKEYIDTNTLGKQEINIVYLNENNEEKDYTFTIDIVDTEKPTITFDKELTTTIGNEINLLKGVSAKDNYTKDIKVSVDGDYDFNKVGEYKIYYTAKDSNC